MRLSRSTRPFRWLSILAVAALAIVGCQTDDTTVDEAPEDGQEEDPDAAPAPDDDPFAEFDEDAFDLPDPNEHVENGVFRGVGVMLPTPEGWVLDDMAFAQGMVVAIGEDGQQTLAAQAVDTNEMPEDVELDYDLLLEENRQGFDVEPSADEEIELQGAERAQLIRYDDLPSPEEGAAPNTLLTLVADDGSGQLAMFNYIAPTDEYDEDTEALLRAEAGFDPDSDPQPPLAID